MAIRIRAWKQRPTPFVQKDDKPRFDEGFDEELLGRLCEDIIQIRKYSSRFGTRWSDCFSECLLPHSQSGAIQLGFRSGECAIGPLYCGHSYLVVDFGDGLAFKL